MFNNYEEQIVDYIVEIVIKDSLLSGFQCIVYFENIEEKYDIKLDDNLIENIYDLLLQREEVADVDLSLEGFDVVIYTHYAENYMN